MSTRRERSGRPRSTEADRAVLDAALDLLIEGGVEAVKMEAVARRSGVARATVYRRYPRREDLVIAAIAESRRAYARPVPDDPAAVPTIEDLLEAMADALADPRGRAVLRRMMTVPRDHPDLFATFREATGTDERERLIGAALRDAAARGAFPADADLDTVQELLMAAIAAHLLTYPDDAGSPQIAQYLHRVLRTLGYRKESR